MLHMRRCQRIEPVSREGLQIKWGQYYAPDCKECCKSRIKEESKNHSQKHNERTEAKAAEKIIVNVVYLFVVIG